MDDNNKGFMTFKGFSEKFNMKDELPMVNPNKLKSQSCT